MDSYFSTLKKFAVCSGRATRKEFWEFTLINVFIAFILGIIEESFFGGSGRLLPAIFNLAVLIPSLAVGCRRLQDTGRSQWWMFLIIVPVLGWVVLLAFFISESHPEDNKYGTLPTKEA